MIRIIDFLPVSGVIILTLKRLRNYGITDVYGDILTLSNMFYDEVNNADGHMWCFFDVSDVVTRDCSWFMYVHNDDNRCYCIQVILSFRCYDTTVSMTNRSCAALYKVPRTSAAAAAAYWVTTHKYSILDIVPLFSGRRRITRCIMINMLLSSDGRSLLEFRGRQSCISFTRYKTRTSVCGGGLMFGYEITHK